MTTNPTPQLIDVKDGYGWPVDHTLMEPLPAPGIKDTTEPVMAEARWQYNNALGDWYDCFEGYDNLLAEYAGDKTRQVWVLAEQPKPLPPLIQYLADAIESSGAKITFGLQPDQIKLIEETINEFGGASAYVFQKVGKQINWEPFTIATYYINYILTNKQ